MQTIMRCLKEEAFTRDDTLEGLTCIVSIKHPNPQFEGQTKTKLGNPEVRAITSQIAGEAIRAYLLENPNDAKVIIEKLFLHHVRELLQEKQERQQEERIHLIT